MFSEVEFKLNGHVHFFFFAESLCHCHCGIQKSRNQIYVSGVLPFLMKLTTKIMDFVHNLNYKQLVDHSVWSH